MADVTLTLSADRAALLMQLLEREEARAAVDALGTPGARLSFTSVSCPRWANAERTAITCLVVFPVHGDEPLPFTAVEVDAGYEHGPEIWRRCLAGDFGPIAPFAG